MGVNFMRSMQVRSKPNELSGGFSKIVGILAVIFAMSAVGISFVLLYDSNESRTAETTNVKEFVVTAENWSFNPYLITVNKGDRVILKITSVEGTHSFWVPAKNIREKLNQGRQVVIEFTADARGEFIFKCGIICGTGHNNMNGTIVIQ